MKKFSLLFLVLALALAVQPVLSEPASSPDGDLIGVWVIDYQATVAAGGDVSGIDESMVVKFVFRADGTWTGTEGQASVVTGEYAESGDTLTVHGDDGSQTVRFRIDADTLTLFGENVGEFFVLRRSQDPPEALIGMWQVDWDATTAAGGEIPSIEDNAPSITFAFGADGAYTQTQGGSTFTTGQYTMTDDTLFLVSGSYSDEAAFQIDGDTLTLTGKSDGEVLVLRKTLKPDETSETPVGIWEADWRATAVAGGSVGFDGESVMTLEFSALGQYTQTIDGEPLDTGEYRVSGDTVTLDPDGRSEELRFRIDGGTLTLSGENKGEVIVFNKTNEK